MAEPAVAPRPAAGPDRAGDPAAVLARLEGWLAARGWRPFGFQRRTWEAFSAGESGLIHVPTGAGKTYAAYFGPLAEAAAARLAAPRAPRGVRLVYLTPLRALARDVEAALAAPVVDLELPITVESRTGDTSPAVRRRQGRRLPEVLVTTPESLTLQLARSDAAERFAGLGAIVVDEWHELLSTKRGTQVELALARLRRLAPGLRTWALSATLANLDEAARAAVGSAAPPPRIVTADLPRPVAVEALLPADPDCLPWAGHLGLAMLPEVVADLDPAVSTLLFTNTRSQCERWYAALRDARPDWEERLGIHHGSLDGAERARVEGGLKSGEVTLVVCTSSLDLGVDFPPVERVYQIGSPKGVARMVQRAGRSAHRPGAACRIVCVPTHALELVEIAAVRDSVARGEVEARRPLHEPLDVLVQHLVTVALGGGFTAGELHAEVRTAWAYRDLTRDGFDRALGLVRDGGGTLAAYPEYRKVAVEDGRFGVPDRRIGRLHRLNIGTITSDAALAVRYLRGGRLGTVEESFLSRLRPGERFLFAGRVLELVRLREGTAWVRRAKGRAEATPRWMGGRLPLSDSLAASLRRALGRADRALAGGGAGSLAAEPELAAALPLLAAQARLSRLPGPDDVLAETCRTREGHHLFLFPFAGRAVHEGLAALLALRAARRRPATFALSANDYGLELLSPDPYPWDEALGPALFSSEGAAVDAAESVNAAELARRQFREVARVAGLVYETYPGGRKTVRQVQTSTSLLYDVFVRFDPGNALLAQARREVLERHFESVRLAATLARMAAARLVVVPTARPTPLAFPLVVERLAGRLSREDLVDRLARMRERWSRP